MDSERLKKQTCSTLEVGKNKSICYIMKELEILRELVALLIIFIVTIFSVST